MRTTVYIDSSSPIFLRGASWDDDQSEDGQANLYSGGTFWSTTAQDSISIDLQAANVDIYGSKASNHGNYEAKVYVPFTLQNPGITETFSGQSPTREFQKMIYSYDFAAGNQDNSVNKLRLGNKGAAGEYLDLDFVVATIKVGEDEEPIITKRFSDSDNAIKYSGNWNKGTIPNRPSTFSRNPGDSLTFNFQGSSVALYGVVDRDHGSYQVSLDGGADITYNSTSSKIQFDAIHYLASHLDQTKQHTVKVTNAGSGAQSVLELLYIVVNSTSSVPAPASPVVVGGQLSSISASAAKTASILPPSSSISVADSASSEFSSTASVISTTNAIDAIASSSGSQQLASIVTEVETSVLETNGVLSTITKTRTHVATQAPPNTGKEASSNATDSSNVTRTGAIVGGALGAVVISCLIIVLLVCMRRRRRAERTERRANYGSSRGASSFAGYDNASQADFGLGRGRSMGSLEKSNDDHVFLPYLGGLNSRQGSPAPSAETMQFYPFIAMGGGTNTTSSTLPREFITPKKHDSSRETETPSDQGRQSVTSSQGRELLGATIQNAQRRSIHLLPSTSEHAVADNHTRPNLRLDPLNSTYVNSTSGSQSTGARSTAMVSAYPSSTTSPIMDRGRPLSSDSAIENKLNRFTASALMSPESAAARSSYLTSKHQDDLRDPFGSAGPSSSPDWASRSTAQPSATTARTLNQANKRAVSGPLSAVSSISPLSIPFTMHSTGFDAPSRSSTATLVSEGAARTPALGTPNSVRKPPQPDPSTPSVPTVPDAYRGANTAQEPPSSARLRKLAEAESLVRAVAVDGLGRDDDDEETRTRPPGYYSRHFPPGSRGSGDR